MMLLENGANIKDLDKAPASIIDSLISSDKDVHIKALQVYLPLLDNIDKKQQIINAIHKKKIINYLRLLATLLIN